MKEYTVTIPIAEHLCVKVEAENEEAAIVKAQDIATLDDLEDWEDLEKFNEGNVCYCPHPWTIEVEEL